MISIYVVMHEPQRSVGNNKLPSMWCSSSNCQLESRSMAIEKQPEGR